VGVGVGVGGGVWSEQGSAQHGKYGGMHTQVPQQQLHSFPTGQLFADGLHSLTIGLGVGIGVVASADEQTASTNASTSRDEVRTITTGTCYSNGSMGKQHAVR
jgi:hypothetical protein